MQQGKWVLAVLWGAMCLNLPLQAETPKPAKTADADKALAAYFADQTKKIESKCLTNISKIEDWTSQQGEARQQLLEMLGLDPLPEKTDLHVVVTKTLDHPDFTVENLHFQSRPGLYVTGNLYVPKGLQKPAPAILYVCGHAKVVENGVSLGGKTHYQHHGGWFARHGYVCLTIDTLQLGEINGTHHGTHHENRWWWLSRGYTPAGVEAWNCIRALDYLQSRPEVDATRLGVTGRSGGGAYSWWISAIDERIQTAVPVAGITDLRNHVVDGVVEGHCDCMFMVNTYRWDYPQVAALNYPRALLLSNTDRDRIFPLDGVYRTYSKVRHLYDLGGVPDNIALNITAGGHLDTQELQMHAYRWFDQHLAASPRLIEAAAKPLFPKPELKVFETIPADEVNTRIDETFVPVAGPFIPVQTPEAWSKQSEAWLSQLQEKSFRAWEENLPQAVTAGDVQTSNGCTVQNYSFTSQQHVDLPLVIVSRDGLAKAKTVVLIPLAHSAWQQLEKDFPALLFASDDTALSATAKAMKARLQEEPVALAYFAPRGVGPTQWNQETKKHIHNQRRFYLLGQSWDGMQAFDLRRAMQALRSLPETQQIPLAIEAEGNLGVLAAYASLFEPPVKRLTLKSLPGSHQPDGPALLNVLRICDIPHALAMAAARSPMTLTADSPEPWGYLLETAKNLKWDEGQLVLNSGK